MKISVSLPGDSMTSMAFPQGLRWKLAGPALLLALCLTAAVHAQSVDEGGPIQRNPDTTRAKAITNDSIVRMVRAELDPSIILQTIRTQPQQYDLSPEGILALKSAGVSDDLIAGMQARQAGLAVRSVPAPGVPPVQPMPQDVGVYYKDSHGDWQPLRTERVVFRSSGWLKNAASYGIVKQDMNGKIDKPASSLKVKPGFEVLIYTPEGTEADEYAFLRLREHKDSREFRTLSGGVFHSQSGTQRDEVDYTPKRIAPRTYTFTIPANTEKGEYGILPPGSANQRGFADTGKIYTFSIPE